MTEEYLRGVVGNASVSRSVRDYGYANGAPSPTEQFEQRVTHFNGRWRVGETLRYTATVPNPDPSVIPSLVKFVEMQGLLGEPVAFTDATYTHGTTTLRIPDVDATERTDDWHVWIYDSSGDTFTPGVYYISSAADASGDADCVLTNALGVAPPGSSCTASGYLLRSRYAEVYCAVPAPVESSSRDQIAANNDSEIALSPWHDYGPWLPPATLVNGGSVKIKLRGRLKMANLAGRPTAISDADTGAPDFYPYTGCYSVDEDGKAYIYLTIDPFSSALVYNVQTHSETLWSRKLPSIFGWTPENKKTAPTIGSNGGNVRFSYTAHGLSDGEVVCVVSANSDDPDAVPANFDGNGQHFYADVTTAGLFFPSTSSTAISAAATTSRVPFTTGDDAFSVAFARQPQRGSFYAMTWKFEFTTADEIADYVECEIEVEGFGDGRATGTEDGTKWVATLRTLPYSEIVGSTDRASAIADSGAKTWTGAIVRTTPGTSSVPQGDGTTASASAAPLRLAKLVYFTATDTIPFTDATTDGSAESITHPYFTGLKPDDKITFSAAGTSSLSTGVNYFGRTWSGNKFTLLLDQADSTTQATFNSSTADVDGDIYPSYSAYFTSAWDYGGQYDIVYLDAELGENTGSPTAGVTGWPINPTYQGSEVTGFVDTRKNSSGTRRATITEVEVSGSAVGEVCHYDEILRVAYVRVFDPENRIKNGDALTFKTYANERTGSGTTWAFNSTAKQTATADALLVKYGPHGTRLSTRFAMSGPPTGDCLLDIRGGTVEINRMRSR